MVEECWEDQIVRVPHGPILSDSSCRWSVISHRRDPKEVIIRSTVLIPFHKFSDDDDCDDDNVIVVQGRRICDLKKQLQDLRAEYGSASTNLEDCKKCKDEAEEGLKGSEVELSMADASILVTQVTLKSTVVSFFLLLISVSVLSVAIEFRICVSALQARCCSLQDGISKIGDDIASLQVC